MTNELHPGEVLSDAVERIVGDVILQASSLGLGAGDSIPERVKAGIKAARLRDPAVKEIIALYTHPAREDGPAGQWQDIATAPKDGTKFDAWCVHPKASSMGVRFTDVQMRGDGSGFGYVVHTERKPLWQYLDARDEGAGFPEWKPTHWMPRPAAPTKEPA